MYGRMFFNFERRSRMFSKGDLKYVILDLLKEKPSHGYEIIRELENRFHGFYSPSAGSVYPTLQMLEDMGYVKSSEQDGKKVYTVTEEGRKFLSEQENTMDKIKDQMRERCGFEGHEDLHDIFDSMRHMAASVNREARRMGPQKISKIRTIITRAFGDIEAVIRE